MTSEVLSKMIRRTEDVYLLGIVVGRGGCRISHLQFADDTMIFFYTSETHLGILRCILYGFEAVLRLKINLEKSELFQVGSVPNIEELAWILGCKIGVLLSSYLGMPLGASFKSIGV